MKATFDGTKIASTRINPMAGKVTGSSTDIDYGPALCIRMDERSAKEFYRLVSIGANTKKKRIKKKIVSRVEKFLEGDCKWITSHNS